MLNSFLKEQVASLENDYKNILVEALTNFATDDFAVIIDEINLFWYVNRDLVKLILQNISLEYDCYTFTGATFLDIDDYEHFPFLALGKVHVVDDPLQKYSKIINSVKEQEFAKRLKEQMLLSIKDNIKIIEEYSNVIYVLPVTMMSDINSDLLKNAAEQAFFSMFKDDTMTLERYCNELRSIEDIDKILKDRVRETLIFSDNGKGDNFCCRFRNYLNQSHPFGNKISDAMIFFYAMNGFFLQAFEILLRCAEYRMIPYLRYEVTFRYTILLGTNFTKNKEMKMILFKSICTHLLYRVFDKNIVKDINFKDFITALNKVSYENNVFKALQESEINLENLSFSKIMETLTKELHRVFESLNLRDN